MSKISKIILIVFLAVVVFSAAIFYSRVFMRKNSENIWESDNTIEETQKFFLENNEMESADTQEKKSEFQSPLDDVEKRITKKPFGFFVSPQNSPVSPERFRGYHTAIDLEVFPEELEKEIAVKAFCSGELVVKRIASGYGGLAIQSCQLEGEPVTVIYGHLKLASVEKNIGEKIETGQIVGILGNAYSSETDGERKHLHFGIHKGSNINMLGYTQSESEISEWIDPCIYVCGV